MVKTLGDFVLHVESGGFTDSEILVLLGENGTGKTTFIRLLAGGLAPDGDTAIPSMNISYKPQKISPQSDTSVRSLFFSKLGTSWQHPQFQTDVVKPLQIEPILDQQIKTLSGGELQRVAIVLALGKPADVYLIDEPSAYLDSEQRIIAARVIKRFILHAKKQHLWWNTILSWPLTWQTELWSTLESHQLIVPLLPRSLSSRE